ALEVARQAIGAVGGLLEHAHALAGRVFHSPVVVNVAEEEIAYFLPPDWSFGGAEVAAEARGNLLDRLRGGNDFLQVRCQLLDPTPLCLGNAAAAGERQRGGCACKFQNCAT